MVTHWDNHWDNIDYTNYSLKMVSIDKNHLIENAKTIFIKLDTITRIPVKAWLGFVSNYRVENDKIRFKVNIEKEINLEELSDEYKNKRPGWYDLDKNAGLPNIPNEYLFFPPLIYLFQFEQNWKDFEYFTYLLLRLIGINNIFRFEEEKQKGTADGFFYIGKLAVLYDATLDINFIQRKKTQITNFINQLTEQRFSIPEKNIDIPISNYDKEVWLITKGTTKTIKRLGDICVKEISISSLIWIYKERLEKDITEKDLSERLRSLS